MAEAESRQIELEIKCKFYQRGALTTVSISGNFFPSGIIAIKLEEVFFKDVL